MVHFCVAAIVLQAAEKPVPQASPPQPAREITVLTDELEPPGATPAGADPSDRKRVNFKTKVVEVLSNGDLKLKGEIVYNVSVQTRTHSFWSALFGYYRYGTRTISYQYTLTGIVKPGAVAADNTVSVKDVSDCTIIMEELRDEPAGRASLR